MGGILYLHWKDEGKKMIGRIKALDLAHRFICLEPMTHKKLQKLCYYAQAWYLVTSGGNKLIPNDFEAWVHGPVCPEIYENFKQYGYDKIYPSKLCVLTKDIEEHILNVYELYGHLSGDELEQLTHSELPWQEARGGTGKFTPLRSVISVDTMQYYYNSLLND